MGKTRNHSEVSGDKYEEYLGAFDDIDLDDDQFFEQFETPSRKRTKRAKDARRLIEQYREDKELEDRLYGYYFHSGD